MLLRQGLSDWLVDRIAYYLEEDLTYEEGLLLEKVWKGSRFVLYVKAKQCKRVGRAMAERYLTKWAALYSDPVIASACRKVAKPK